MIQKTFFSYEKWKYFQNLSFNLLFKSDRKVFKNAFFKKENTILDLKFSTLLFQIILALAICVFLTYGAPLEEEKEKNGRRQGKTLGLVTAGAQSIAPIVATAGKGVVGLLAGVSAILPLAKLGLAKCK